MKLGESSKLFIEWSQPIKLETKYGQKWMRWWGIPRDYLEGFFIFWNNSKEKLKAQGVDPVGSTPEAFTAFIQAETAKWARVLREAGIKAE